MFVFTKKEFECHERRITQSSKARTQQVQVQKVHSSSSMACHADHVHFLHNVLNEAQTLCCAFLATACWHYHISYRFNPCCGTCVNFAIGADTFFPAREVHCTAVASVPVHCVCALHGSVTAVVVLPMLAYKRAAAAACARPLSFLPAQPAARLSVLAVLGLAVVLLVRAAGSGGALHGFGRYGQAAWFSEDLPSPSYVYWWPEWVRDRRLPTLSRWDLSPEHWRQFVYHTVSSLGLPPPPSPGQSAADASSATRFTFAEIGCGVGAFSRVLLRDYPNSKMEGVDLVPGAVDIARVVLPADRSLVLVGDAVSTGLPADSADFVMLPGVICYLGERQLVLRALAEIVRVGKDGGTAVLSMVPQTDQGKKSCLMSVPRDFWSSEDVKALGLAVKDFQSMEDWACCVDHGRDRYAVTLRIRKQKGDGK